MSKLNFIYEAKVKLISLVSEYITKETYGYNTDCVKAKIMKLKTLITTVERYIDPYSTNKVNGNILYLQGKKIILSKNNSYICKSEDQTIDVNHVYLNCITEEELCVAVGKIKSIIHQ